VPPGPLQTIVKLVPSVRGAVAVVPVGGRVPLQPPEAAQALALAAFHCRLTGEPISTLLSLAFNVSDGGRVAAVAPAAVVPAASTV
jgi:hypothetical protein